MSNRTRFLNHAFSHNVERIEQARSRPGQRIINLERDGRLIEPSYALHSARKEPERINVSRPERLVSIILGAGMVAYGVSRRSWTGVGLALAGLGLIIRGKSGHCHVYSALDVNTAFESGEANGVHVEEAITIDRSAEELYGFWRNFENHALITDHLESVRVTGATTTHWVAKGPADSAIEWEAETINDVPNELIAWQTLPGSEIEHAGSVRFRTSADKIGTEVIVTMQYYPPAGPVGAGLASLIHWNPAEQTVEMLKRFKLLMETECILAAVPAGGMRAQMGLGE